MAFCEGLSALKAGAGINRYTCRSTQTAAHRYVIWRHRQLGAPPPVVARVEDEQVAVGVECLAQWFYMPLPAVFWRHHRLGPQPPVVSGIGDEYVAIRIDRHSPWYCQLCSHTACGPTPG